MSMSCAYPNKSTSHAAERSGVFAEDLAEFDLSHYYTVAIEEELCLFFARVFNIDILHNPLNANDDKGRFKDVDMNILVYQWDDIPVLQFTLVPDNESYNYDIHCVRMYVVDEEFQN